MPEKTELKDVVSVATKILRYLPNSDTSQILKKSLLCSHFPLPCILKPCFVIMHIHTEDRNTL